MLEAAKSEVEVQAKNCKGHLRLLGISMDTRY